MYIYTRSTVVFWWVVNILQTLLWHKQKLSFNSCKLISLYWLRNPRTWKQSFTTVIVNNKYKNSYFNKCKVMSSIWCYSLLYVTDWMLHVAGVYLSSHIFYFYSFNHLISQFLKLSSSFYFYWNDFVLRRLIWIDQ